MEFDATDIIGNKYGQLTVKSFVKKTRYKKYKRFKYYYKCKCDCGNTKEIVRTNLICNHATSCGCLRKRTGKQNPCWSGCGDISGRFWNHIMSHANKRDLKFLISIEDAWQKFLEQDKCCALTGLPLIMVSVCVQDRYPQKRTASLDRVDSSQGYTLENIQWVHKDINKMKMKMEETCFIGWCNLVSQFCGKDKKNVS